MDITLNSRVGCSHLVHASYVIDEKSLSLKIISYTPIIIKRCLEEDKSLPPILGEVDFAILGQRFYYYVPLHHSIICNEGYHLVDVYEKVAE